MNDVFLPDMANTSSPTAVEYGRMFCYHVSITLCSCVKIPRPMNLGSTFVEALPYGDTDYYIYFLLFYSAEYGRIHSDRRIETMSCNVKSHRTEILTETAGLSTI